MKKDFKKIRPIVVVVSVVSFTAASVFADAYRNPAPTAEGVAKAGANMIFVDDASAISYGPANLAFQTNNSLVVAVNFARAQNTYDNPLAPKIESEDLWAVLPNLYFSMPVADGVVAGLGITTPYGQGIEWDSADLTPPPFIPITGPILYEATMAVININPTIALKLSDTVAVAFGADIYYGDLEFDALAPVTAPPPPQVLVDTDADGDGWALGGNVAVTWKMTEKQRVAASYRSRADLTYKGDYSLGGDFEMKVKYPNIYGVGYGIQLTDTIQVEALLEWIQWSSTDTTKVDAGVLGTIELDYDWDDTITAALGGSWQFADSWALSTGYTFIETPIPDETVSPTLPDTDRHIIGIGVGYSNGRHSLDLAYAHTYYDDKDAPAGSVAPGSYDIDSDLINVTYSLSF